MEQLNLHQRARRVTRFIVVQLIALIGWTLVQLVYMLSPLGRIIPFSLITVIEAGWWIALFIILFLLFKQEFDHFAESALDVEKANWQLRRRTNRFFSELREQNSPEERTL